MLAIIVQRVLKTKRSIGAAFQVKMLETARQYCVMILTYCLVATCGLASQQIHYGIGVALPMNRVARKNLIQIADLSLTQR